jgi:uncharacterized protein YbaR (Trm112 family)
MRFYLLDKLICPQCNHFPLSVKVSMQQEARALKVNVFPCTMYCAYNGAKLVERPPDELPCSSCLKQQIISGELICPSCHSRYPIENGIPALLVGLSKWVKEEQTWWDKHYTRIADQVDALKSRKAGQDVPGNRWFERNRYLFTPLKARGFQSPVLEIGSGMSQYVAGLLPPSGEHYLYIGTDVSRIALEKAAQLVPEGDFIQCDIDRMPFRRETFDVVLSLGVLHHIPHWQVNLRKLVGLLRPGGWMLFDEAIDKPRVLGRFRKQSLTAAIDSPHEGEISFEELLDILKYEGRLINYCVKSTPLRVLMVWIGGPWIERSLLLTRMMHKADKLFMKSAGKLFKSLGGGEIIGIFEKRSR